MENLSKKIKKAFTEYHNLTTAYVTIYSNLKKVDINNLKITKFYENN